MRPEYAVIKYLLNEAEDQERLIEKIIQTGETKWSANYGKRQLIKDNMKKIRQLALKIGK